MRKLVVAFAFMVPAAIAAAALPYALLLQGSTTREAAASILLIRHADATVGQDSKTNLVIDDCRTQRNLSDAGRGQAVQLGRKLRAEGIVVGKVLTSPMCRAYETARLLNIGLVQQSRHFLDITNNKHIADQLLKAERDIIARWNGPATLIIVTHSSNIRELTGHDAGPAETIVLPPRTQLARSASLNR